MTLILSGTDGLSDIDGSASTPAIRGTDANTGIFFPAADTIAFSEGGAEAMRIDSSGNVGIGTSSPRAKLSVTNGTENTSGDAPQETIITGANQTITSGLGILTVQSNTAIGADVGATIALGGRIRNTGLTTDASNFAVLKGAKENATSDNSAGYFAISTKPNALAPVERMRIDSSGKLLVGTTGTVDLGFGTQQLTVRSTSGSASIFDCASGVNEPAIIGITASTSGYTSNVVDLRTGMAAGTGFTFIAAAASGTTRFQVLGNGDVRNTNNSYGAISDAKLKENIVDATPKLDDLMQVRVRNYNLIGDDQKQIGVVAQELEQVFPGMVDESQDKDTDGSLTDTYTKSVKYSVFVPILIKAMQELKSELDSVKAELATLKGA